MRMCARCVMNDASDPTIIFDANNYCNYCNEQLERMKNVYFPNEVGKEKLHTLIGKIKEDGKGKTYDCLMGISGGLDSSYLAYLGHKWGLRILAVHIDDGFDTEISKSNIKKLVSKAGIELVTIKPDEKQYLALTKAYMKAGVPNLAIPQDNILFALLYDYAKKMNIRYFLSGGNFALECILQRGNTYNAMDTVNIKAINRKYGEDKLDKLKFISSYRKYLNQKLGRIYTVRPLDYINYNRDRAFKELYEFCGFEYYGRKHLENILTAFIQLYWLPTKFGVDKRYSHLSSMIISGQLSRADALKELEVPVYDESVMNEYIDIIKNRFRMTDEEFKEIMEAPVHQHTDYHTDKIAMLLRKIIK